MLASISIIGIQPETVFGIAEVREVYRALGEKFVLTCITDGVHSPKSLHYVGYGFDVRTKNLVKHTSAQMAKACRRQLGREWDVVVKKDHLHFEFQPKRNRRS